MFYPVVKESNLQPIDEESKYRGLGNFKPEPLFYLKRSGRISKGRNK